MDSDMSHETLARFQAIEARLDALDGGIQSSNGGNGEEETAEESGEGEEEGESETVASRRGGRRRQSTIESSYAESTTGEVSY